MPAPSSPFKSLKWRSRKSQPFFPLTYCFKVMTVLSGDFDMFAKKVRSSVKIEIVEKYMRSSRDAVVPSLEESGCCRFAADGTHLPCFVGSCLSASWPAEVFQTPQKKRKKSMF